MLIAYGNGTLFGESYGDGSVRVLWLHGWGRSSGDFREAATALADAGVASVALDLPGFGSSPLPTVAGGARHYAELVAPLLVELGPTPLVLVGHSFGGRIATVLAARYPERVSGVVLTGVPLIRSLGKSSSPLRYRVIKALAKRGLIGADAMERARQRFGSADYRNASGILRDVLVASVNESYDDELAAITTPTTFVWGAEDTAAPLAMATQAATLMATPPTMVTITSLGHFVPTEAPTALVAAALGYCS